MARSLYEWLWQHEFWLPPGITWEDMQESEDVHYPQPRDLLLSIPFALILVVIRCAFERAIALPLSTKLGVRDKQRPKPQPSPLLETFYSTRRKNPEEGELLNLAKQCDLPVRKVEKWFRRRRNMDRPSLSKKFSEACWRFTFYIISFFTGLAVLYDVSTYPLQPSLFLYYMLELSFYWSLVFTLPFDVKRKDFKEQIVHHAATIFLISFSYCANYIRIGTLVMVIHDASDYIPTLLWILLCECSSDNSAAAPCLLVLPNYSHGLQVHPPGHGMHQFVSFTSHREGGSIQTA
uniref:Homeobox domain-containing protein n=1 Tax=Catharus ustulatus TaxID=91951 RepID=A0A8C3V048_CATUS